MRILFKYPTYGRPVQFQKTLGLYYEKMKNKNNSFLITMNEDDISMNNKQTIEFLESHPNLIYKFGHHKTKIEAFNADMQGMDFDILVVISDDMIPIVNGYDEIIRVDMINHFPDLNGGLHYNDGIQGPNICTLTIMGRQLYDYFGYVYHPSYKSFYCDREYTEVLKIQNKLFYSPHIIIRHKHKGDDFDETYRKNIKTLKQDMEVYNERRAKGFPL